MFHENNGGLKQNGNKEFYVNLVGKSVLRKIDSSNKEKRVFK